MSGGEALFTLSLVAPAILGFLIGRWRFLLVAIGVWIGIAIFLRENNGWYGAGWGDFGIELNVLWAVLTCLSAVVGIALRRGVRRWRDHAAA